MPRIGVCMRPNWMSSGTIRFTVLAGIAKPYHCCSARTVNRRISSCNSPSEFSRGPPEFPGLCGIGRMTSIFATGCRSISPRALTPDGHCGQGRKGYQWQPPYDYLQQRESPGTIGVSSTLSASIFGTADHDWEQHPPVRHQGHPILESASTRSACCTTYS